MKKQPKTKVKKKVKKIEYKEDLEEEKLPERDEDGIEIIP
jgi:hypothetical protein